MRLHNPALHPLHCLFRFFARVNGCSASQEPALQSVAIRPAPLPHAFPPLPSSARRTSHVRSSLVNRAITDQLILFTRTLRGGPVFPFK